MKELSIEEKAKAYDEAIKRGLDYIRHTPATEMVTHQDIFEAIFPELKETKDERIRKTLIGFFGKGAGHNCTINGISDKDILTWLKKQSEPEDKGEISDGCHTFNELYRYRMLYNAAFFNLLPKHMVHKSKKHHDGKECFDGGWFIVMANLPTGQISNHYKLKDWDLFQIPEKEIADEWDGHTPQEAAERLHKYLLEKQGEQKPFNYEHVNIQQKDFALLKPKFKVGDWIIDNEYGEVLKVTKADANSYEITTQDGEVFDILKEDVECNYRLWTIADAKDGDVLVSPPEIGSESNEQIFLFKAINSRDYVDNCIEYYGRLCDGSFYKNKTGYMGTTLDTFYPATKEQRELLFQKMADAGYEFVNGHITRF